MKCTKVDALIQRTLDKLLQEYPSLHDVIYAVEKHHGRSLLVGGAVRDMFLELPMKDLDVEVHNLTLEQLQKILSMFGVVNMVGKSFGVLRVRGLEIDWSVPRADSSGRKPVVTLDPYMSIKEAFKRRDVTINAMGIDLCTKEFIDPFNGKQDIYNKVLRATDRALFVEDPLRLFRVMQFIGRFEMTPDGELDDLCRTMSIDTVSRERIEIEFTKLFLKSRRPSSGIRWLDHIGRLSEVLPELATTKGIPQNPQWHPEGDVFEHTMQALDAAATFEYASERQRLIILYAVLCHDLGKATTTEEHQGRLVSYGHAQESERLSKDLLKRITHDQEIIKPVRKLVRYHMYPGQFVQSKAHNAAYKRLAHKLAPEVTLLMLGQLAMADRQGRNGKGSEPLSYPDEEVTAFIKNAEQLKILEQKEEPLLQGRDLLDVVKPGPSLGKLLKKAYEIQIKENITDKHELKERVLKKYE